MSTGAVSKKNDSDKNREELLLELRYLRALNSRQQDIIKRYENGDNGTVDERKKIENALRDSEERFRVLADASMAGIIVYQGENTLYLNQAMADIEGYPLEERRRMKFWETIHPDFQDEVRVRGAARQRGGETVPSRNEMKIIRKDGEERWVVSSAGVFKYNEKPAVILVIQDITERKKAEEALKAAKTETELYVDLMGHDINNMNQITMGYLELAHNIMEYEGKLGLDNIYLLDRAIDSLNNSSRLIDNVRKIQREKMGLYKPEVLDVGEILEELVAHFRKVPNREVYINYASEEGCLVRANMLLKDVFINLIGNSIKHSASPLTINVHVCKVDQDGRRYCKVAVEDNGPGIPDSLKHTLFDRLNLASAKARGKGFGLCLIKMLVDDYNGKFSVEDRVAGDHKQGCRFVVMLPVAE